jgi:hypothetical protein
VNVALNQKAQIFSDYGLHYFSGHVKGGLPLACFPASGPKSLLVACGDAVYRLQPVRLSDSDMGASPPVRLGPPCKTVNWPPAKYLVFRGQDTNVGKDQSNSSLSSSSNDSAFLIRPTKKAPGLS